MNGFKFLSSRDRQAIAAYEEHCKSNGLTPNDAGRHEWVNEWRTLDEEQRQDALEAQWHEARGEAAHWPDARGIHAGAATA